MVLVTVNAAQVSLPLAWRTLVTEQTLSGAV